MVKEAVKVKAPKRCFQDKPQIRVRYKSSMKSRIVWYGCYNLNGHESNPNTLRWGYLNLKWAKQVFSIKT